MKSFLKSVGIGLSVACFSYLLMLCIFNEASTRAGIIGTFTMGVLIGAVSCVYNIKQLPLLAKVAIQLTVGLIIFIIVSLYNEWYTVSTLWIAIIIFLVIFAIIWFVFYFATYKAIDKMNKKIEEKNH